MPGRQITLAEVARHAGVSLATASRVINGSDRQVSDPLRDRVMASADSLGYLPNASAQALARNSSSLVGLVVHDIADPYFSSIAAGVTRVAEDAGLVVVLGTTARSADRERELLATLRGHRAKAVVMIGSRSTRRTVTAKLADEVAAFTEQGGRVACVSQAKLAVDTVVPSNRAGAKALAVALAELGHRKFVVLGGPEELLTSRDRVGGFRAGLADSGVALPDESIRYGEFTRDGGYDTATELLAEGTDATCVFAVNDVMALGAMAAMRAAGMRVPDDISVAGFDDIPTLRDVSPTLTTVRLPLEEMGARAAHMALGDHDGSPRTVRIAAEVVLRESTRKL
ncbi:MAG TPA: LacI family DNA-binding transcriptional regulator [Kutzneria sp.]|nr:LacI family DNA-binding transcriptional regulator [Kutzneria sp.]